MSEGPTAGHAESNACGDTSRAARRSAQEPAEGDAIHRATSAGILSVHGEEDVKQHLGNIWDRQKCVSHQFVRRACSTAWRCKSSSQPDRGEVIANRKGVAARRGLKEALSKNASQCTR